MLRERYYRTVCCECCEDKKREAMKVEFDPEKSETILHLDADEMAEFLFALEMTAMNASNPAQRKKSKEIHDEIRKGM